MRSRQPDGTQATSNRGVVVALQASLQDDPSRAPRISQPTNQIVERRPFTALREHGATAVTRLSERRSLARDAALAGTQPDETPPGTPTTVVSGDSLWRMSRVNYGEGERYHAIYDANRNKIRNPNQIYPGQILIIPDSAGSASR